MSHQKTHTQLLLGESAPSVKQCPPEEMASSEGGQRRKNTEQLAKALRVRWGPSRQVTVQCVKCGTTFQTVLCKLPEKKFCSRKCRYSGTLSDRLMMDITKLGDEECWPWNGHRDERGYGKFTFHRKFHRAHRAMYQVAIGPTGDLDVCHKCDNPTCCNPKHLFLGTQADNNRDRHKKGRYNSCLRGEAVKNSILTAELVVELRKKYTGKYGSIRALMREYNLKNSVVRSAVKRVTWRHVP